VAAKNVCVRVRCVKTCQPSSARGTFVADAPTWKNDSAAASRTTTKYGGKMRVTRPTA
jgi:hypothetical protein